MVMAETLSGQTFNVSASGSFSPRQHEAAMSMDVALPPSQGGEQTFRLVMSGDVFYMKFPPALASKIPGGKSWFSIDLNKFGQAANLPGLGSLVDSASRLNDPGAYLDFLRAAAAGSVITVGQETVGGIATTHYQAELQFSKLAEAVPARDRASVRQLIGAMQQQANIQDSPVDVWIDSSGLIRRLMMNTKETVSGREIDVQMTENFSDYGPQRVPTPPNSTETADLLSLIGTGGG